MEYRWWKVRRLAVSFSIVSLLCIAYKSVPRLTKCLLTCDSSGIGIRSRAHTSSLEHTSPPADTSCG